MAKVDLADGYYRIPLSSWAALELSVMLPADGLAEPLIGAPLSLPMGWKASPPPPTSVPTPKPVPISPTLPHLPPHHTHSATPYANCPTMQSIYPLQLT